MGGLWACAVDVLEHKFTAYFFGKYLLVNEMDRHKLAWKVTLIHFQITYQNKRIQLIGQNNYIFILKPVSFSESSQSLLIALLARGRKNGRVTGAPFTKYLGA